MKYCNQLWGSERPWNGAITLLWRLCTSPVGLSDEPEARTDWWTTRPPSYDATSGRRLSTLPNAGGRHIQTTKLLKNALVGLRDHNPQAKDP